MNNNYRANPTAYTKDLDKMIDLIEKQHGGCEDEECSMNQLLNDHNSSCEEIVYWWACSGAQCTEFNKLYTKHEKIIKKELKF